MVHKKNKSAVTFLACIFAAASLSMGSLSPGIDAAEYREQTPSATILGDLNGDNKVSFEDDRLFKEYFAGNRGAKPNLSNADVDNDGMVTRKDAMFLARCLAGWEGYVLIKEENPIRFLWETFGEKTPEQYAWWEYEMLTDEIKEAFYDSFASDDRFLEWLNNAQENSVLPWENGGKQPVEYIWWEYEILPDELKEAFYESFETDDEFIEWLNNAQMDTVLPWEIGGKRPEEYAWWEFILIPAELQEAFYDSFASDDEFTEWLNNAQENSTLPWKNSGE